MTVTANVTITTYTSLLCPTGSCNAPLTVDVTNSTSFELWEWDLPWSSNISALYLQLPSPVRDPLLGQSVFGLNVSNPYNDSAPISATPYLLDSSGVWLSPVTLANYGPSTTATLVVPPSLKELQALCEPICDVDPQPTAIIFPGQGPVVSGPLVPLPPFSDSVSEFQIPEFSGKLTIVLALASGAAMECQVSQQSSLTVPLKVTPLGAVQVMEADPTFPIVLTMPATYISSLTGSLSLSTTLTILNSSACIVPMGWTYTNGKNPTPVTRTFAHTFAAAVGYDNTPIGMASMQYGQTMYFPMGWYDESSVAISGTVTWAINSLLPGV